MTEQISFQIELAEDYEDAIERVTTALKEEGFGVLTHINVKETLKNKINVDFRRYAILGACNPPLAHRALSKNPLVGLVLPCNVTVEELENGGSLVNLIDPQLMLMSLPHFAEDEDLQILATEAREKIQRAANALRS